MPLYWYHVFCKTVFIYKDKKIQILTGAPLPTFLSKGFPKKPIESNVLLNSADIWSLDVVVFCERITIPDNVFKFMIDNFDFVE